MRDCRAETNRSRFFTLAVALACLTAGAAGPALYAEGRQVVADFAPGWFDAQAAEDAQAAAALVAAGASAHPVSFPREAAAIRAELDRTTAPSAVAELIDRLGIVGDASDVRRLEVHADSRTARTRAAAFNALGRISDDKALDVLLAYVRSSDWAVSRPAIEALGRSDSPRALRELRALAADPDPTTRQSAWGALALRGGPEARAVLHRVARTCTPQEAWAAMYAVAALGEVVDQKLLVAIAKTGTQQKASSALSALSSFPASGIADALIELAVHGPYHRRGEAIAALGSVDDPRVVPILEDAARGRRADRAQALNALGRSRAPGAFEALVAAADEVSPGDAYAAALVSRPEPEAREVLREMATEDTPLGESALAALANANDEAATELMIAAFDERGVLPPANALNHLALHGGDDGWSLLEEVLATGDAASRSTVVWALQQRGDDHAADRLLDLARTGDRNVASAALSSLEQMGDGARDGLRSLLMERITEGTDADFGQSAQVLARLGGDEVLELLTGRLESGTATEKQTALGALAQMGEPEATAAIAKVFHESDDPSVRVQALNQLVWSDDYDEELLDAALADDDPSVVAAAASTLGMQGGEGATERLLALTESDDPTIRTSAMASLAQVGGEEADAALIAGLHDPDVAPSIMWTLSNSSSPQVRSALRDVAREGDPTLRSSAISALSMDTDPGTTDLLVEALRDDEQSVAQSALYALQSRGSSSSADAIAELFDELPEDDEPYGMRHQVASALQAIGGPAARERAELLDSVLSPEAFLHDMDFGGEELSLPVHDVPALHIE